MIGDALTLEVSKSGPYSEFNAESLLLMCDKLGSVNYFGTTSRGICSEKCESYGTELVQRSFLTNSPSKQCILHHPLQKSISDSKGSQFVKIQVHANMFDFLVCHFQRTTNLLVIFNTPFPRDYCLFKRVESVPRLFT